MNDEVLWAAFVFLIGVSFAAGRALAVQHRQEKDLKALRNDYVRLVRLLEDQGDAFRREVLRIDERSAVNGENIRMLIGFARASLAGVTNRGLRTALKETIVVRNSDADLNYVKMRELVQKHGRPPQRVLEAIRRIVEDASLDDDLKIAGAIGNAFSEEQLERAYEIHGPDPDTADAVFLLVIHKCRERGTDAVLRDCDLID